MKLTFHANFDQALANAPETQASFSVYSAESLSRARNEYGMPHQYLTSQKGIMYSIVTGDHNVKFLNQVQPGASLTAGLPSIVLLHEDGNLTFTGLSMQSRSAMAKVYKPNNEKFLTALATDLASNGFIYQSTDKILFSKVSETETLYHTKK